MTCHPASVACKPKVDSLAIRYHLSLFQMTRAYMPYGKNHIHALLFVMPKA
jgi:hypothetical protein